MSDSLSHTNVCLEDIQTAHITQQVETANTLYPDENLTAVQLDGATVAITTPLFTQKLNRVCGFAVNTPVTESTLDKIEDLFRAVSVQPFIELSPFACPGAREMLEARGYTVSGHINTHILSLKEYTLPVDNENNNISITRIVPTDKNDESKRVFTDIAVEAFKPGGRSIELLTALATIAVRRPDTHLYLAHIDNKPVGCAAVAVLDTKHGQVPLFYMTGTLSDFQGRGVQGALLRTGLRDVKQAGLEIAVMETRPGGASARNAGRVGFRVAYVKETFTPVYRAGRE
ncbi:hypothetical protein BDV18DRAFT_158929 [Aspergillus unguis]